MARVGDCVTFSGCSLGYMLADSKDEFCHLEIGVNEELARVVHSVVLIGRGCLGAREMATAFKTSLRKRGNSILISALSSSTTQYSMEFRPYFWNRLFFKQFEIRLFLTEGRVQRVVIDSEHLRPSSTFIAEFK